MANWMQIWESKISTDYKKQDIECLASVFADNPPKTMLDIGCGFAWESRAMNQIFGTQLWLLDGDSSSNTKETKDVGWRATANKMAFYNTLDQLTIKLQELGTKDYTLVDANNINIDNNVKFDLVYSGISCGFHYPADTYRDLIEKHSHSNTKIIFDLRKKRVAQGDITIKRQLLQGPKHVKCEIQFVSQS